jgi:hypothetical protein
MGKRYKSKTAPLYEYVEVWSDTVGMVLQIVQGSNIGQRFWVAHKTAGRFYDEILPEKWLLVSERANGTVHVRGPAIKGTGYPGYFSSANEAWNWGVEHGRNLEGNLRVIKVT